MAVSSRFDGGGKQSDIQLSFYTYCENGGQAEDRKPINAPNQHFLFEQQAIEWASSLSDIKDSTLGGQNLEKKKQQTFEWQGKIWSELAIKHETQILRKQGFVIPGADEGILTAY